MLTYIVRRLLYSIPVLIISTFLSFTFVSLAGNPTLALKANPRFSQHTVDLISARYHLSDPIPVRYGYWVRDVFTHKLGNEVDVKIAWEMTKQVVIDAGVGFLFGSKVLELSLGGPGAPDAERQTLLFTLGMDLRF